MAVGTTILAARTKVVLNSTDYSGDFNQVKLNYTQSAVDVTTFNVTGWKKFISSISEGNFDLTGFGQAAGHTLDAELFAMLGAPALPTTWEIDAPTSSAGAIRYTGNGFLKSYNMDCKPTDAFKLTASMSINNAPTRAIISS